MPLDRVTRPDGPSRPSSSRWASAAVMFLAIAQHAQAAPPQSPLVTTFADDNGNAAGGSVFFDVDVHAAGGITLTALDLNTSSAFGELDVWIVAGGHANHAGNQAAWTHRGSGQLVGAGSGNPTAVCLSPAVHLPPGSYGIALSGNGTAHRYTNGAPGVPLVYGNADLTLTAGAASTLPFGGAQYAPRVWNGRLHYLVGASAGLTCARSVRVGDGCVDGAVSFYEEFDDLGAFDLAGTTAAPGGIVATAAGSVGYVVLPSNGAWHVPTGSAVHNQAAVPTELGDDDMSGPLALPFAFPFAGGGSTNVVHAASNGYLVLGPTTATTSDLLPTATKLLQQAPRLAPLWCDLHPSANRAVHALAGVYYDVLPGGQEVVITWLDVGDGRAGTPTAGATSVNVQCVLRSNGDFEFRYAELTPGAGFGHALCGWSPGVATGGPARDPGSFDLSTNLPLTTTGPDSFPLEHTAGLARLGQTIELHVAHAENVMPFAVLVAGSALPSPGIDLTPHGAPGCRAWVTLGVSTTVPLAFPGGTGTFALAVPNQAALLSASFASQFAALSTRTTLGLTTSNSMVWTLGR